MIARPPIMCFDFGALKILEFSTIFFRDLTIVGAQGAVLRIPNFYFSECPNVRGGRLIKEGPTLHYTRAYYNVLVSIFFSLSLYFPILPCI